MRQLEQEVLEEIVRRIVEVAQPEKIILAVRWAQEAIERGIGR